MGGMVGRQDICHMASGAGGVVVDGDLGDAGFEVEAEAVGACCLCDRFRIRRFQRPTCELRVERPMASDSCEHAPAPSHACVMVRAAMLAMFCRVSCGGTPMARTLGRSEGQLCGGPRLVGRGCRRRQRLSRPRGGRQRGGRGVKCSIGERVAVHGPGGGVVDCRRLEGVRAGSRPGGAV